MRDRYESATQISGGTAPVILFLLCVMVGMIGCLVVLGDTFSPHPMPRVYLADMPELYAKPVAGR